MVALVDWRQKHTLFISNVTTLKNIWNQGFSSTIFFAQRHIHSMTLSSNMVPYYCEWDEENMFFTMFFSRLWRSWIKCTMKNSWRHWVKSREAKQKIHSLVSKKLIYCEQKIYRKKSLKIIICKWRNEQK